MYPIDMTPMTSEFYKCWYAAAMHLQARMDGGKHSWLRCHPRPPYSTHLSFRLANQLFFVRVEDVDGRIDGPGNPDLLVSHAAATRGHACVMPMKRIGSSDKWRAVEADWGLVDATTSRSVNPVMLMSDERIEMGDWEVQDMAVEVVRRHIEGKGYEVTSWQSLPGIDPSIWFVGDSKTLEWVVVRSTRYPAERAAWPADWEEIATACELDGKVGHFASVSLASTQQAVEQDPDVVVPLWRGYAMHVRFTGLE
jgi:hypothetical protein